MPDDNDRRLTLDEIHQVLDAQERLGFADSTQPVDVRAMRRILKHLPALIHTARREAAYYATLDGMQFPGLTPLGYMAPRECRELGRMHEEELNKLRTQVDTLLAELRTRQAEAVTPESETRADGVQYSTSVQVPETLTLDVHYWKHDSSGILSMWCHPERVRNHPRAVLDALVTHCNGGEWVTLRRGLTQAELVRGWSPALVSELHEGLAKAAALLGLHKEPRIPLPADTPEMLRERLFTFIAQRVRDKRVVHS